MHSRIYFIIFIANMSIIAVPEMLAGRQSYRHAKHSNSRRFLGMRRVFRWHGRYFDL